eukprot:scaffold84667_cov31-Tisochrysis_lutea.AAC.2
MHRPGKKRFNNYEDRAAAAAKASDDAAFMSMVRLALPPQHRASSIAPRSARVSRRSPLTHSPTFASTCIHRSSHTVRLLRLTLLQLRRKQPSRKRKLSVLLWVVRVAEIC